MGTTIDAIDQPRRNAARIAGVAYLLSMFTVIGVNYGILGRIFVRDDLAATSRNILAHERLFRLGTAGLLLYAVIIIVLLSAIYVILKPVNQNLALLATFLRLVHAVTWVVVALNLFTALRLLSDAGYSHAFGSDQLSALVRLHISGRDIYYVGLLFWSLSSAVGSWLWLKSKYVPAGLAAFGVLSSAWAVACTLVFYVFPTFKDVVDWSWWDIPMTLFELVLACWLLFKGLPVNQFTND